MLSMAATLDNDFLRQQMMVNQFVNAVGCSTDQAQQMLQSAEWSIEAAYSMYFDDHSIGVSNGISINSKVAYSHCVPNNTPVTPSQFSDIVNGLSQLKTTSTSYEMPHEMVCSSERQDKCGSNEDNSTSLTYQLTNSNECQQPKEYTY